MKGLAETNTFVIDHDDCIVVAFWRQYIYMSISVAHVAYSNGQGGAGIAASRINSALIKSGFDSKLGIAEDFNKDNESFKITNKSVIHSKVRARLLLEISKFLYHDYNYHSFNIFPSGIHRNINRINSDIINLHWINRELIAFYEIGKITKPLFWTLHDMWPLLGSTHIEQYHFSGYQETRKIGTKIDCYLKTRKFKEFANGINWIAPSGWMKNQIVEYFPIEGDNIPVIPNPINAEVFKFSNSEEIQDANHILDDKRPTILFGAAGGISNQIKGFDYLYASYKIVRKKYPDVRLALFGQQEFPEYLNEDQNVLNLGVIKNPFTLSAIFNKCSVLALPSIIDNLPQVAVEAVSSGTPVVAFNVGGVSDIVKHGINGFLVQFKDIKMFAEALIESIENSTGLLSRQEISAQAHLQYSFDVIASKYMQHYSHVILQGRN